MTLSAIPDSFDVVTIVDGEQIGWIQVFSCVDAKSSTFTYPDGQSAGDFVEYFPEAIAVQFLTREKTPADYDFGVNGYPIAVMTEICSNPVIALNNNLDLSWPINVTTLQNPGFAANKQYVDDNWKGSPMALERLIQNTGCDCTPHNPSNIYDPCGDDGLHIYWTCCNFGGLHLDSRSVGMDGGFEKGQCSWDYATDLPGIGGLSLWLGFAANKDKCCIVEDGDGVLTTDCPTLKDPCTDNANTGGFIDGFVTISTSVFYALFVFAVVGVFSVFGWSTYGIKSFVQSQTKGIVKFEKVESMEDEDQVYLK